MHKLTVSMIASAAAMLPALANADATLSLKLDPGLAAPLTSPQASRFNAGGALSVKPLANLTPWLGVGPTLSVIALQSNIKGVDAGAAWEAGIGAIVRRPHDANHSEWLDADFQVVKTGDLVRPAVSAGVGVAFPTSNAHNVWIGPFVRVQNIFPTTSNPNVDARDAKIVILGVSFEFEGVHSKPAVSDRDHDVVPDSEDLCPDVPGPASNNGCPLPMQAVVPVPAPVPSVVVPTPTPVAPVEFQLNERFQFDWDSAVLHDDATPILAEVVHGLLANTDYNVKIEGHASSEGNPDHNQVLSVNRAKSVYNWLVDHGVARERLTVVGFGSSKPVEDNATEAGRVANRRVEFEVVLTVSNGVSR